MLHLIWKVAKKYIKRVYTEKVRSAEMIQAVSFVNANASKRPRFGDEQETKSAAKKPVLEKPEAAQRETKSAKKPSAAKAIAGYLGTQFVAGAVFSGLLDGMTNLYRVIKKNKPVIPLKELSLRAAAIGGLFALVGVVFGAIGALVSRKSQ